MKKNYLFTAILLIFVYSAFIIQAQKTSDTRENESANTRLKEVDVYFWFIGTEGIEDKLVPLKRKVSAEAPLRPAIEDLLKDPTEAEQKLGFVSTAYGDLKLVSVKITNGAARIDFSRTIGKNYNPGDLLTLRFESAVIKTAAQFPTVKNTIVCVNGMNEFGIGMVIDAPIPCPKEK